MQPTRTPWGDNECINSAPWGARDKLAGDQHDEKDAEDQIKEEDVLPHKG